jgi:allantoin racemase
VIVLGCTAEYGFFSELQERLGAPVVDATVAPFKYAELLGELAASFGWRPSKVGGYAAPPQSELEAFGLEELSLQHDRAEAERAALLRR